MFLIAIDPGKSSGGCVLSYDDSGVTLELAVQVLGGVGGFRELVTRLQRYDATWISEKFSPRPGAFGQSLDSTIPLVCEGVLIDRGLLPEYSPKEKQWVQPAMQYLVGGKDLKDRRRRQHRFLKESGFYRTGKDLDAPDADDFRSACAHAVSYLMRSGHKPSYELVSEWIARNPV